MGDDPFVLFCAQKAYLCARLYLLYYKRGKKTRAFERFLAGFGGNLRLHLPNALPGPTSVIFYGYFTYIGADRLKETEEHLC